VPTNVWTLRAASNFSAGARPRADALSIEPRGRVLQPLYPLALPVAHRAACVDGDGEFRRW
jgi:hypothetical protein